jgi:predicted dehydrogenase
MNVAILGSGFGLYGYFPALCEHHCRVLLPERYRAVLQNRPELSHLMENVRWMTDEKDAIGLADAVVVACRPADQAGMIAELVSKPKLKRLLLEKPLAIDPDTATHVLTQLERSKKIIRIGYAFGFTGWGGGLAAAANGSNVEMFIRWTFRAHHYATDRSNWKRLHSQGGGALRFYGIQLIGLLAALGFDEVVSSRIATVKSDEVESWRACLANKKGARCDLELDSNAAQNSFSVHAPALGVDVALADPFDGPTVDDGDRRVPVLSALCKETLSAEQSPHPWYRNTIELWRRIEAVSNLGKYP